MPRERVVLTREDSSANEYSRFYRRGFTFIGAGALFDVAAAVLIVLGSMAAGVALAIVGILISLLAVREFNRAGQAVDSQRGY